MEVINSNSATLSNNEVLNHLQKIKDSKRKHKGQLATITYETLRYLENTTYKHQSIEDIKNCLKELEPYKLNKTEKIMFVNSPPKNALEIQLMIEDSEERLSDEQVEQIVEIVAKNVPHIKEKFEENNINNSD